MTTDEKQLGVVIHDEEEQPTEEMRCGWRSCRPNWLQHCYNKKGNLALMFLFAFCQGMLISGLNPSTYSLWERLYKYSSLETAKISASYDVVSGLCAFAVAYIGGGRKTPRLFVISNLSFALGAIMLTMPNWVTLGTSSTEEQGSSFCDIDQEISNDCDGGTSDLKYFLYAGQVINGFGGAIMWSLAVPFIDDSVPAVDTPLYVALFYLGSSIGIAFGFVLSAVTLQVYTEFWNWPEGMTPAHSEWVGAWWIGYLVVACLHLLTAFLFSCYDKELPEAEEVRMNRISETQKGKEAEKQELTWDAIKKNNWALLTNSTFVFICVGVIGQTLVISGYGTFMPKIISTQFNMSPSAAALAGGFLIAFGVVGGQLASGMLCKYLKLTVRGLLLSVLISMSFAILGTSVAFVHCETAPTYGVNRPYDTPLFASEATNLTTSCNSGCGCSEGDWSPVCYQTGEEDRGIQYFSACYAGCPPHPEGASDYENCTCLPAGDTLSPNLCNNVCSAAYVYIVCMLFILFAALFVQIPALQATIRCCDDNIRAYAMGIQTTIWKFLGAIPAPLLVGYLIDQACMLFQHSCADKDDEENCLLTDNKQLSIYIAIFLFSCYVLGFTSFLIAFVTYIPPSGQPLGEWFKSICSKEGTPDEDEVSIKNAADMNIQEAGKQNGGFTEDASETEF